MTARMAPEVRRSQPVDVTLGLLGDRAPGELVVDDVAIAAGVSRALVYRYFSGLDELLVAAYQRFFVRLQIDDDALLHTAPDARTGFLRAVYLYLEFAQANAITYRHLVDGGLALNSDVRRIRSRRFHRLARFLGNDTGAVVTATAIVGLLELATLAWLEHGDDDIEHATSGMTYKAAAAGLPLGGGKAVIVGDPARLKSRELLLAYGRFIDTLAGRYVMAADIGTSSDDLDLIGTTTPHAVGRSTDTGGSGDSGYATALRVFGAMRAASEHRWGSPSLESRSVGVEGVGKVGAHLVDLLIRAGARVVVAEPSAPARERIVASHPEVTVRASVLSSALTSSHHAPWAAPSLPTA